MSSSSTATAPSTQSGRPLLSIVISNYNYARFLRPAIDSALAQTYQNIEVIAVDDGSTDESRAVIESYGSRISSVFKPNGGQGSALNAGFAASRGEVVIFLDSDDKLFPNAADEIVKAWRPNVAKVRFQTEMIDANGAPFGGRTPELEVSLPDMGSHELIGRRKGSRIAPLRGNAFSRAALERVMPLDERRWTTPADKPLWALTPFFGDVVVLQKSLGEYRIHETNESNLGGRYLDRLHRRLTETPYLPDTLCETAKQIGIDLDPRQVGSTLRRVKIRMSSLCLDPSTHPIATDNRLGLLLAGIGALAREPNLSLRNRIANFVWLTTMCVSTRKLAAYLCTPPR